MVSSPSILALVETKVKANRKAKIRKCMPANWSSVDSSSLSPKGKIWFGWDSKYLAMYIN